jgi:hypothetical protein
MAMHHGARLRDRFVDSQVQTDLACVGLRAANNAIVQINQADLLRLDIGFAHHRGSTEDKVIGQPAGHISTVAIDVFPLPELPPNRNDLPL